MDLKGMASNIMSSGKIQEFLQGLNFPISKQELINKIREKGADNNIMSSLQKMTDKQYQTPADVVDEFRKTQ